MKINLIFKLFCIFFFILKGDLTVLSQNKSNCVPCQELNLRVKESVFSIIHQGQYFYFDLKNCGSSRLPIHTSPNYEYENLELDYQFYISIYKLDDAAGYLPYHTERIGSSQLFEDSITYIEPQKSYTFSFPILSLYPIKETGRYRITGFYRERNENGTYHLIISSPIEIVVRD